jgi:hypothetical protein
MVSKIGPKGWEVLLEIHEVIKLKSKGGPGASFLSRGLAGIPGHAWTTPEGKGEKRRSLGSGL